MAGNGVIMFRVPQRVLGSRMAQANHSNHPNHQHAVDIHAHYFPQTFLDLIAANAGTYGFEHLVVQGKGPQFKIGHLATGPVGRKFIDLDTRLAAMDGQGVEVHLLSLSQPMVYWAKRDLAQCLTESYNDGLAAAHERNPKRFYGLATLPMHEPDLAVREVERASKLPGVRGFYMATHVLERELSDPLFFPVYERIESLGLPIFLHPVEVIGHQRLATHYLTNLLGNPFESAIAAAHLIFGGVLDPFPKLTFFLPP